MTTFSFLVVLNKHKNKKHRKLCFKDQQGSFFAFEEKMKNDILYFKGKTKSAIEMCARGKKYIGIHSIKNYSETFAPLQTGVW